MAADRVRVLVDGVAMTQGPGIVEDYAGSVAAYQAINPGADVQAVQHRKPSGPPAGPPAQNFGSSRCLRGPKPRDWDAYLDWLKVDCLCRSCTRNG